MDEQVGSCQNTSQCFSSTGAAANSFWPLADGFDLIVSFCRGLEEVLFFGLEVASVAALLAARFCSSPDSFAIGTSTPSIRPQVGHRLALSFSNQSSISFKRPSCCRFSSGSCFSSSLFMTIGTYLSMNACSSILAYLHNA